ncbi:MAG: type 2 isopentenyl-diphosphate Delta-isomerase [Ignavibacteriae bacterium]|nr:type 2 isopentenyl-diphosphate Delta-isomerase [Ignavibacteriota bacterium]MCB9217610.1 type 2 isopentenyl-diphosphate Delta-isomerase [Ignavibacteria bacterium]
MQNEERTPSRKRDHVDLCVGEDVTFRGKTTGLEKYELLHNALPEMNPEDVDTRVTFLGKHSTLPLIINSMTGGYEEAERINRELAEVCQEIGIPLGLGSQRQAMESGRFHESWRVARRAAPSIPIFGNIGAPEIAKGVETGTIQKLVELIEADGFAVHLNPLQELMQPEGNPEFRGVLSGIERLARELPVPIIVKEVGAGLSADVVQRLLDVGVRHIDISGAGGTSWSGVELLRSPLRESDNPFWDWGIPTAEAVAEARPLCEEAGATLIASGGISSSRDVAISIALGANIAASARPMLQTLMAGGQQSLTHLLREWERHLRYMMFLVGAKTVAALRNAPLRRI